MGGTGGAGEMYNSGELKPGGRAVDGSGLENQRVSTGSVGSNPTLSVGDRAARDFQSGASIDSPELKG